MTQRDPAERRQRMQAIEGFAVMIGFLVIVGTASIAIAVLIGLALRSLTNPFIARELGVLAGFLFARFMVHTKLRRDAGHRSGRPPEPEEDEGSFMQRVIDAAYESQGIYHP